MPRIKEITLYKFSELSPEAQDKAINDFRELLWRYGDDMQIHYDDLKYELKHNPNYIADFSDDYCMKHNAGMLQEYCQLKAIYSVEIDRLDTSHRDCKVSISFNNSIILSKLVLDLFPKQSKRIQSLIDAGRIDFGHSDTIRYYGNAANSPAIDKICEALDTAFIGITEELKGDYEHWLLRLTEAQEEFISSDEYIRETIEANDYEFTANRTRE